MDLVCAIWSLVQILCASFFEVETFRRDLSAYEVLFRLLYVQSASLYPFQVERNEMFAIREDFTLKSAGCQWRLIQHVICNRFLLSQMYIALS